MQSTTPCGTSSQAALMASRSAVLGYEAYQALYRSLLIIHTARYGLIYVSHELRLSCGLDLLARMMTKHV